MRIVFAFVVLLTTGAALAVAAPDPPAGASSCSGCHGPAGGSGLMPINGRDEVDLTTAMEAFRSGARPSTVMGRLMKGFSPDEIRAIAAWIAAQK
jgi:cytochrome subunit of sulfide dehydrogenase